MFVELMCGERYKILLVNCYISYYINENIILEYVNLLQKIQSLVINNNYYNVLIAGDFNCHLDSVLYNELNSFIRDNSYVASDIDILGFNCSKFTYISGIHKSIKSLKILDKYITSDHKPIQIVLDRVFECNFALCETNLSNNFIDWSKCGPDEH